MSWALILLLQPCSMHEGKHEQNLTFNNPKNHEKKTFRVRKFTFKNDNNDGEIK